MRCIEREHAGEIEILRTAREEQGIAVIEQFAKAEPAGVYGGTINRLTGNTYNYPVSAMDVLPTSCAASGVPALNDSEGVNLLLYLSGRNAAAPHETLFWRFGPQRALRQGRWKLVDARDMETKTQSDWQLYDLSVDIGETTNLASSRFDLVDKLGAEWDQWNASNVSPRWHGSPHEDPTAPATSPKASK